MTTCPKNHKDIEYLDFEPEPGDLLAEVQALLSGEQKRLPTMLLYDEKGSKLFDQICELPEYYPTRTETAILNDNAVEIAEALGSKAMLVEFGSGSSMKTRILLDHMDDLVSYVPIDISREHLLAAAEAVAEDYPDVPVQPVVADYMAPFDLPTPPEPPEQTTGFFPGSTVGNLVERQAVAFLRNVCDVVGDGGSLLLGADLRKDRKILEAAYNDAAGVTAAFNLNALDVVNDRLGADFDVDQFRHEAVYDNDAGRIEMRLVSQERQSVQVGDKTIEFEPQEYILTEYSHKYRLEDVAAMAARVGMTVERVWTDPDELFSVQHLRVTGAGSRQSA